MSGLDARFAALAHPLRRTMLGRLALRPRTISDMASGASMTFAAVSRHLRVLEEAGLVKRTVEGREHWFEARPASLAPAEAWIARQSRRWQKSLDALKTIVESEMDAESPLRATAKVHIAAPPERVFAAWLDPDKAKRFLGAYTSSVGEIELDPRPGGALFVAMVDGERRLLHRGEFLVVDPPRRLVFTWLSDGTGLRTTVVSVDFIAERGGTTVRLVHEGFAAPEGVRPHSGGWQTILDKLKATVG